MPHMDFDGKKYRASSSPMRSWGESVLADLVLAGNERVVDLGCGTGELSARLAERVPRGSVLGMDASESMIAEAQKNHRLDNLSFCVGDIDKLGFDSEVDLFFSNAALHWVKDHDRLLAALYRGLAPGGRARLSFGGKGNCPVFLNAVLNLIESPPFARAFADYSWPWYMPDVPEYEERVKALPFSAARVWNQEIRQDFGDEKAFCAWMDQPALVPFQTHLARRAPELCEPFREAAAAKVVPGCLRPDGSLRETFMRINVFLEK